MKKKICLFAYLLINSMVIYGQEKKANIVTSNISDIILEGKIVDSILIKKPDEKKLITIKISKYPFTPLYTSRATHLLYEIETTYNKAFKIVIPTTSERLYMSIVYSSSMGKSWSSQDNTYMLNKGDHISCRLSDEYFEFSGKGSEKLNCQSELYKLKYTPTDEDLDLVTNKQLDRYADITFKKRDSIFNLQKKIIEKYRPILGIDLSETFFANCYGLKYWAWLSKARFMETDSPYGNEYKAFIESSAYKKFNIDSFDKLEDRNIEASYIFAEFLFYKILVDQVISYNNDKLRINSNEYLQHVFKSIQKKSASIIKDKLIALFVMNYRKSIYLNNYLDKAILLVQSPLYKEILLDIKTQDLVGSPFFAFELENTSGEIVKLTNFNSMVVFVDLWFTGCGPCAGLKKAMQPIYEKYKTNPKIAFISISSDKDKQMWLRSVGSGVYTDPSSINLYTGGMGLNHPLYKYHNIVGAPNIYLLKDGKIYSSPLPRPKFIKGEDQFQEENTKKLISLIEKAITSTSK
jgi:thiol-disulfide isomerase/thioredoxin